MLNSSMLKELSMKTIGEMSVILNLVKEPPPSLSSLANYAKTPTAKLNQIHSERIQQFQKFKIDGDVFTQISNLPLTQSNISQDNCADETVQNSIINTYLDSFNTDLSKLLDMLEVFVTQKWIPMAHRISFSSILHSETNQFKKYLIRLRCCRADNYVDSVNFYKCCDVTQTRQRRQKSRMFSLNANFYLANNTNEKSICRSELCRLLVV